MAGGGYRVGDRYLGRLEGVADDTRPELERLQFQASHAPVCHGVERSVAAQEGGKFVDQREVLR